MSVRQLSLEFADRVSSDGFSDVKRSRTCCGKTAWTLFIVVAWFMVFYQIGSYVIKYTSYPVTTTVELKFDDSAAFPAVTVCNLNPVKRSEAAKYLHRDHPVLKLPPRPHTRQRRGANGAEEREHKRCRLGQRDVEVCCRLYPHLPFCNQNAEATTPDSGKEATTLGERQSTSGPTSPSSTVSLTTSASPSTVSTQSSSTMSAIHVPSTTTSTTSAEPTITSTNSTTTDAATTPTSTAASSPTTTTTTTAPNTAESSTTSTSTVTTHAPYTTTTTVVPTSSSTTTMPPTQESTVITPTTTADPTTTTTPTAATIPTSVTSSPSSTTTSPATTDTAVPSRTSTSMATAPYTTVVPTSSTTTATMAEETTTTTTTISPTSSISTPTKSSSSSLAFTSSSAPLTTDTVVATSTTLADSTPVSESGISTTTTTRLTGTDSSMASASTPTATSTTTMTVPSSVQPSSSDVTTSTTSPTTESVSQTVTASSVGTTTSTPETAQSSDESSTASPSSTAIVTDSTSAGSTSETSVRNAAAGTTESNKAESVSQTVTASSVGTTTSTPETAQSSDESSTASPSSTAIVTDSTSAGSTSETSVRNAAAGTTESNKAETPPAPNSTQSMATSSLSATTEPAVLTITSVPLPASPDTAQTSESSSTGSPSTAIPTDSSSAGSISETSRQNAAAGTTESNKAETTLADNYTQSTESSPLAGTTEPVAPTTTSIPLLASSTTTSTSGSTTDETVAVHSTTIITSVTEESSATTTDEAVQHALPSTVSDRQMSPTSESSTLLPETDSTAQTESSETASTAAVDPGDGSTRAEPTLHRLPAASTELYASQVTTDLPTTQTDIPAYQDPYLETADKPWKRDDHPEDILEQNAFYGEYLNYSDEMKEQIGHKLGEMLLECVWKQRQCHSTDDFTHFLHPTFGNCFTFNAGFLRNPNGEAYFSPIKRTGMPGPFDGLSLSFYVEGEEYLPMLASSTGVRIMIHNQGTVPNLEDAGFTVSTGFSTAIEIRKVEIGRLPLPYNDVDCREDFTSSGDAVHAFWPPANYTMIMCMKQCHQDRLRKVCGCIEAESFYFGDNGPVAACNMSSEADGPCKRELDWDFRHGSLSADCRKVCPQPCDEVEFEVQLSHAHWPSPYYADLLRQSSNHRSDSFDDFMQDRPADDSKVRENVLKIDVYYQSLNYKSIREEKAYGFLDMLADFGGALDLWVGMSVLAAIQFVEFFVEVILLSMRTPRHPHRQSSMFERRFGSADSAFTDYDDPTPIQPV